MHFLSASSQAGEDRGKMGVVLAAILALSQGGGTGLQATEVPGKSSRRGTLSLGCFHCLCPLLDTFSGENLQRIFQKGSPRLSLLFPEEDWPGYTWSPGQLDSAAAAGPGPLPAASAALPQFVPSLLGGDNTCM